ncbi:hypothetical protein NYR77_01490 [Actinobacillus equuli subsp. haemolyticus]|uniref:hypothetical protein n=1 Tax=Actinobacillus equuli TaxID=718 RepID=UPI0024420E83|nr:hypothetical protein [Actinobacillus equuli]WGE47866.1 hypothetical protein NYR67_06145 [Actinobacillus equuli subsp. equuli]WGE67730.1 hypothetical protein NYR77_01490 [Actinobacillus equuli subsp. haemolyticus]WGE75698.1 hypothetical protein NYR81_01520 [Actinobacillus equuli subsp. haemolyticus]WGE76561.1 hypothetical protein NYR82_06490 [Actinobacillus equuli subsp. haemolyticus]
MSFKETLIRKKDAYYKSGFNYSFIKKQKAIDQKFIGNSSIHDLDMVVYGYSVGYKNLYKPFLPRIIDWLSEGIDNNECFGTLAFHQNNLNSALAFATWINTGVNDVELWKKSLKWREELYGNEDYSKGMSRDDKEIFALSLLHYIQAQEYEKAIKLYQSVKGDKLLKLNKNMSGYRLAYAYCLHFYENKFTVEQLEKAAKPFLEKHLQMLYSMGRPTEMLYWLKMVCDAREKEYTPEEVIYSFYEYISEEEKPEFVKELLARKVEKKSFFSFLKW